MMINYSGSIAVDFSRVKGIRKEYLSKGGNLVFEMDDLCQWIENPFTEEKELQSFPNSPIKYYFELTDHLDGCFDEWVEIWAEWREKETN